MPTIDFATDFLKTALSTKEKIEAEINDLRKQESETVGNEKYKLFEKRQPLHAQLAAAKEIVLIAENGVQAAKNNGEIIPVYTDKKGKQHLFVPDFRKVDTTTIIFDEETILTEPSPKYIPKLDEELLKRKSFVLDAMRIDKDTYIVSIAEHREEQGGYVILTLDQLVLTSDYYLTKAKATNTLVAKQRTQRQEEYYDNLSEERRERHLNQKGFYNSLPVAVKKKITQVEYEKLDWREKEKLYKPFKRYGAERITSKLDEHHMWHSTHLMYERFVNPEATAPKKGYANDEVFKYWSAFRSFLEYKIKDIKIQREDLSDVRKAALETSFGVSNTSDALLEKYAILVKRQNGDKINPAEIAQIETAWIKVNRVYGNLKPIAGQLNLKISHSGDKYIFASRAVGMWVSSFSTIAISNKYGSDEFDDTAAHESAHMIDYFIGKANGKRYATDDYESTAGQIAFTFRKNLNTKTDSDYVNATKECFARAMQQYFAIKTRGDGASLLYSEGALNTNESYFVSNNFVNQSVFTSTIKPLIEKFLEENKEVFKTAFVEVETEAINPNAKPLEEPKKEVMNKIPEYSEAIELPKGGAVKMNKYNFQASAAETIAKYHSMQPKAIYNWANKHKVDLRAKGYILSNATYNSELVADVLNDEYKETKKIIEDKKKHTWKVKEVDSTGKTVSEKTFDTNDEARKYYDANKDNGNSWGIAPVLGSESANETFRYEKRKDGIYRIGNKTGEESYMGKAPEFGRLPVGKTDNLPEKVFLVAEINSELPERHWFYKKGTGYETQKFLSGKKFKKTFEEVADEISKQIKLPTSPFYAEIKPIRVGGEPVFVRISPDAVGDFVAGYVIYGSPTSNKKEGYLKKEQLQDFLQSGEYKIVDKLKTKWSIDGNEEFVVKYISKDRMKLKGKMRGSTKTWICAKNREEAAKEVREFDDFGVLISVNKTGKKGGCEIEEDIPVAIVQSALNNTVTDIGQLSKEEKNDLNKAVKKGILIKGKGGPYPALKTVYAAPGFDIPEDRRKQLVELKVLPDDKKPIILKISSEKPLSYQLSQITGDGWNAIDYESLDGGNPTTMAPFRHKKTGQVFIVAPKDEKAKPSKEDRVKNAEQFIKDVEHNAELRNMTESQIIGIGLQFEANYRTGTAQKRDEKHDGKKRLSPTPENLIRWMKHPGMFDLIGVDTFERKDATSDYKREISKQKFWNNIFNLKVNV